MAHLLEIQVLYYFWDKRHILSKKKVAEGSGKGYFTQGRVVLSGVKSTEAMITDQNTRDQCIYSIFQHIKGH